MRKLITNTVLLMCLSSVVSFGQRRTEPEKKSSLDDSKYFGYGVTTNTHSGIFGGLVFRSSTPISERDNLPVHRYMALELVNVKHPKEFQRAN
ncbi:MAG: hypothetical protein ACI9K1_000627, partial [Arcticibacterium sp.]